MRKIDTFKAAGFLRGTPALVIGLLTVLGMVYTDSFEALCAVLLIGSSFIVLADNFFSK